MANKKTIKYCNEPPALTGHINPDDMRRIFGKVIPLQAPNNPVKPIESTCYYLFKAGVDCLRINEAQNNTKAWYYTSPSIEKYIGHPFSWPLAKGLVTDQNIINMLENGLMPTDMWLRCENCNAYDHYTIMLYYKKVTTSVIKLSLVPGRVFHRMPHKLEIGSDRAHIICAPIITSLNLA